MRKFILTSIKKVDNIANVRFDKPNQIDRKEVDQVDNIKFDFRELEGRIVAKFGKRYAFAAAAGYTPAKLSSRLRGTTQFSLDEVHHLCQPHLLDIAPEDIPRYFLRPKFD